ncbi:TNF receptor-associated factor 6-A isoform X2 [Homalodisca vitripennis]|uniref:TNF receptor-associated factor 6-A isoform X2 n=1 Tax=Homalodisca vitripennis TaxID=197043 RepID=UPI001EEC571F|nr:TNF receptor-associated factor 6-A isoform X2 [Homalodisca vitripennis]
MYSWKQNDRKSHLSINRTKEVSNKKDLEKHFLNLRSEVHNELTTIKILLLKINQEVANLHHALSPQVNKTCQTSNSEEGNPNIVVRGPRDSEINQYNATIHIDQNGNNVFSYFWRIVEIRSKIVQQTQAVLRSPSFYVNQQYRMYIKLLPHQDKGSVYVHVGLTHGHYDNLLPWPFRLRHRVSVVDQTLQEPQDLASRIWDPTVLCSVSDWRQPLPTRDNDECVGFGFTQSTIFSQDYVHNDSIILRLDVFLQ